MEIKPRVSVVIPVYNGSNFLAQAIDSAIAQTWPNTEVLVVDDGSDDGGATVRIARSYGERIRLIGKDHGGVSAALNAGIREMTGDYFAWLSHDDVYHSHKLERQVEALERHGRDAIAYSDYELVGPDLRRIKRKAMPNVAPAAFRLWLTTSSALHGCTVLVPRSCFDDERFDERLSTTQDYDMWFRLAGNHRFVHVPEILLQYRIHGRQESWTNPKRIEEGNRLLIGFLNDIGPDEMRAAADQSPSTVYLRAAVRFKLRGYALAAARALDLSRNAPGSRRGRLSPVRLVTLAAYHLASPRLRPMYWWKRFNLGATREVRPAASGTAQARAGVRTPPDPAADT